MHMHKNSLLIIKLLYRNRTWKIYMFLSFAYLFPTTAIFLVVEIASCLKPYTYYTMIKLSHYDYGINKTNYLWSP